MRTLLYCIIALLFITSCSEDPVNPANPPSDVPSTDGIIYATPKSKAGEGFTEAMLLNDTIMLLNEDNNGSSLIITPDFQNVTIINFDKNNVIESLQTFDIYIQGYKEHGSNEYSYTLYTNDDEINLGKINVKTHTLAPTKATADFEKFDAPIVTRAIQTKDFIDNTKDLVSPDLDLSTFVTDIIIDKFKDRCITDPAAKFVFETGTIIITGGVTGELYSIPLDIALSLYMNGNDVIARLRERAYRKCAGDLSAVLISARQASGDVYDIDFAVGAVNTIPAEYRGKNIVGLLYKEVEISSDDNWVDLFDNNAEIIFQAAPVYDYKYSVNKEVGHNKKIILRTFIMPATEVPRWQNGLITRSSTSLIKYTDPLIFINAPTNVSYRQLDFKGQIKIQNRKVVDKQVLLSLEFTGKNDAYLRDSPTPITDWGVILYYDGVEKERISMVTCKDNPLDNTTPNDVCSTQNYTFSASLFHIDYDNFSVTSDRWTYGTFTTYYTPPYNVVNTIYGQQKPLDLRYSGAPSHKWTECIVNNVRPYKGTEPNVFGQYGCHYTQKNSGLLFVDEMHNLYYNAMTQNTINMADSGYTVVDGDFSDGIRAYQFYQYEDCYEGFRLLISAGRVFRSENCIHRYCNGTISSFYNAMCDYFPGQTNVR